MSIITFCLRGRQLSNKIEASYARLYRLAFAWTHDEMLAEDLSQEAIAKGLQRIEQLKDHQAVESWLITILNNLWRDYLRKQRPQTEIDDIVYCCEDTPEKQHQRHQTVNQVREAIARLPIGQRQTITLVDLEGMSYSEVSQSLDIPIGTVMSRLNRARQSLQAELASQPETPQLLLRGVR